MAATDLPVRERGFVDFTRQAPLAAGARRHWPMRSANFSVEWIAFGTPADHCEVASTAEMLVLVARGALDVTGPDGTPTAVPADAVAILPAGRSVLQGEAGTAVAVIASQRDDLAPDRCLNADDYRSPDPRLVPTGRPYRRIGPAGAVQVLAFDEIKASADRPRLKMLQTATLSINIVDYAGPRDRTALSPHSHDRFEQGSLALAGDFVHHLRTPWRSDANAWRDDEHLQAPSPSLVIVPAEVIHTSEGVGAGRHVLIDVFSPPRQDFIANGWVFNARDYVAHG